jgi:hypothetical protein
MPWKVEGRHTAILFRISPKQSLGNAVMSKGYVSSKVIVRVKAPLD